MPNLTKKEGVLVDFIFFYVSIAVSIAGFRALGLKPEGNAGILFRRFYGLDKAFFKFIFILTIDKVIGWIRWSAGKTCIITFSSIFCCSRYMNFIDLMGFLFEIKS